MGCANAKQSFWHFNKCILAVLKVSMNANVHLRKYMLSKQPET